ncbi:MAG: hypothetical protein ACQESL_00990, partial [Bacteroidota bacterium]
KCRTAQVQDSPSAGQPKCRTAQVQDSPSAVPTVPSGENVAGRPSPAYTGTGSQFQLSPSNFRILASSLPHLLSYVTPSGF